MATAKKAATKKSPAKKSAPKKAETKKSAKKSSAKKSAPKKSATTRRSENASSTGRGKAKKEPAKQTSHCWPGYKPVPGKKSGTKGSCEPKSNQTKSEKKSDSMAAAGSKLRKAGGSKKRANQSS